MSEGRGIFAIAIRGRSGKLPPRHSARVRLFVYSFITAMIILALVATSTNQTNGQVTTWSQLRHPNTESEAREFLADLGCSQPFPTQARQTLLRPFVALPIAAVLIAVTLLFGPA